MIKPIKTCGTVIKVEKVIVVPLAPQYINTILLHDGKLMQVATKDTGMVVGESYCQ